MNKFKFGRQTDFAKVVLTKKSFSSPQETQDGHRIQIITKLRKVLPVSYLISQVFAKKLSETGKKRERKAYFMRIASAYGLGDHRKKKLKKEDSLIN